MSNFNINLKRDCRPDWENPPNTIQPLATVSNFKYAEERDIAYPYLTAVLKRASKRWSDLWEVIVDEATQCLRNPSESLTLRRHVSNFRDPLGAADPFVLLAVGLEVRLFQWKMGANDGKGEVVALSPERVLSSLQELERIEIGNFLQRAAAQHLENRGVSPEQVSLHQDTSVGKKDKT